MIYNFVLQANAVSHSDDTGNQLAGSIVENHKTNADYVLLGKASKGYIFTSQVCHI